jgi:hypothetical protein
MVMTGRRGDFHLRGTRSSLLRHKVPIGVILRRVRSRRAGIHIRALWLPAAHMCISVANVSPMRSRAANTSSHVESMCIGLPPIRESMTVRVRLAGGCLESRGHLDAGHSIDGELKSAGLHLPEGRPAC